MVDNVTVGSVCAQSPSFMPDLDGEKNKTELFVDDIIAYLKSPSVYSLEKAGSLSDFVNNSSNFSSNFMYCSFYFDCQSINKFAWINDT